MTASLHRHRGLTVRRAAIEALGDRAGTVVVMNPKTGQVYTVVNQEFALRHGVKPCSTSRCEKWRRSPRKGLRPSRRRIAMTEDMS